MEGPAETEEGQFVPSASALYKCPISPPLVLSLFPIRFSRVLVRKRCSNADKSTFLKKKNYTLMVFVLVRHSYT